MIVINLPNDWSLTILKYFEKEEWIFHHKCLNDSPTLGRLQQNTHKRYGKRYRCNKCKTIAPKEVVMHFKLKKIGDVR